MNGAYAWATAQNVPVMLRAHNEVAPKPHGVAMERHGALLCRGTYTRRGSKGDAQSYGGVMARSNATIRFPVTCPKCGTERLTEFPADVVADALARGSEICLVATCHDVIWDASALELEQIREYFGATSKAALTGA